MKKFINIFNWFVDKDDDFFFYFLTHSADK